MRPNQWVRVTKKDSPNYGKVCAVEHGRPVTVAAVDSWTGRGVTGPHYPVIYPGSLIGGPLCVFATQIATPAAHVELLGPEECAALDAEYGLTPKDGE